MFPLFSCCNAKAAHDDKNVPGRDGLDEIPVVAEKPGIDYLRSPESFTMLRIESGIYNNDANKILKTQGKSAIELAASSHGLVLGDLRRPARTLLEASSRRMVKHITARMERAEREAKESGATLAKTFTDGYMKALQEGNAKWASDPGVSELLHKDVKLTTHDKQHFFGSTAVIRRLNIGVENLMKMATQRGSGEDAKEAASQAVEISEPQEKEEGKWITIYTVKYGIRKFKFQDELVIRQRKIKRIKRSRV